MSRRAGGSSAGSTEPPEEDAVDGVGEAADRAVRRWKEMGEERFRRWGRARRWGLERTWSGQVAAAAAVDAMDGDGSGGRRRISVLVVKRRAGYLFFRERKTNTAGGEEMSGAEKQSDSNQGAVWFTSHASHTNVWCYQIVGRKKSLDHDLNE
jgi:hypothetical protein